MTIHLTKAAFGLLVGGVLVGAAGGGCGTDVTTRVVTATIPAACAAGSNTPNGYATYTLLGDYQDAPTEQDSFSNVGASLPSFRTDGKELLVSAFLPAAVGAWFGEAAVPPAGDIDVLLWPRTASCQLTVPSDARAGASLGMSGDGRLLVAGGAPANPKAYVVSTTTGLATSLTDGLLTPRSRATVTAIPSGAVAAGGVDAQSSPLATAEVFDAQLNGVGDFVGAAIELSVPRTDHGAVGLVDGRVLLVGGSTGPGGSVLGSMEIVDPVARRAVTQGIAPLAFPRIRPTVLRLATGQILVAGGVDATNAPVRILEWFAYDPSSSEVSPQGQLDLGPTAAGETWTFAPLPAGGALAVVGRACDAAHPNTWVVRGDEEAASTCTTDACPGGAPLGAVRLFAGPQGEPVLWTGQNDWLRWQAWDGTFDCIGNGITGPAPADVDTTPEPGLVAWLSTEATPTHLSGYRFDARSAYAPLGNAPLFTQTTLYTAPDRLVLPTVTRDIVFETGVGLTLAGCAGGLCPSAFVTDSTFADLTLDVNVMAGLAAPKVVLRADSGTEYEVGGTGCPYTAAPTQAVHLTRAGSTVSVGIDGAAPVACGTPVDATARMSVGLRSSQQAVPSGAVSLSIQRQ